MAKTISHERCQWVTNIKSSATLEPLFEIYYENLSKLIDIQDGIQKFDDYEDVLNDEASKNPDFLYAGMTKQNISTL